MDTTTQNRLNFETDKVLYNTYVSHAAMNMDWLATGEMLDDKEHAIESRLKFWQFDVENQNYALNTQVELPHENGIRALEFSTPYSIDNLLCASCGQFDVKIWALEDSQNIYSNYFFFFSLFSLLILNFNSLSFNNRKRQILGMHWHYIVQKLTHKIVSLLHGHLIIGCWIW